jgi:uncharacterized integral membrane protein
MKDLKLLGILLLLILIISGSVWCNYKFWRVQHPAAPTWSWFLSGGKY